MKRRKLNFFSRVYQLTKKIPAGKVVTYGWLAKKLGTREARKVGFALHANRDSRIPCHRVVNRKGELAKNFGWGGWQEQKRRLEKEGIFVAGNKVDLLRYQLD